MCVYVCVCVLGVVIVRWRTGAAARVAHSWRLLWRVHAKQRGCALPSARPPPSHRAPLDQTKERARRSLTALGLPVELDERLPAARRDELERVHAKALHVAVVERHADVVEQKRELVLVCCVLVLVFCYRWCYGVMVALWGCYGVMGVV